MELGLRGRTAIVCGGSAGIGLGCAEALTEAGANVVLFARGREGLERQAERLGAVPVVGDVRNPDDLARLVDTAVERFGGVDVLLLNSGGPPRTGSFEFSTSCSRMRSTCCCSPRSGSCVSACPTSRQAAAAA